MKKTKTIIKNIIILIILLFSFTLTFSLEWLYKTFGNLTLEEILFQVRVPMTGSNTDFYFDYAKKVLPFIIISTALSFSIILLVFKRKKFKKQKAKRMKTSHADTLKIKLAILI